MLNHTLLATRSLIFYSGHYLLIVIFACTGVLLRPASLEQRLRFIRTGVNLSLFWLRVTCNIRHQVNNFECIDPKTPSIIISRHESTWEALAFHSIFPLQINIVKQELRNVPFFGLILVTINSILIDRSDGIKSLRKVKKEGSKAISNGLWVTIFPGGTRVAPGQLSTIHSGGAILAKQEKVPVYLVTHNSGKAWPKGTFIKHPGVISVDIKPLKGIEHKDLKSINRETQEWFQRPQQIEKTVSVVSTHSNAPRDSA